VYSAYASSDRSVELLTVHSYLHHFFQPTCPSSSWYVSRPVSCKYCAVASTTVRSGFQLSLSPSNSLLEFRSLRFPYPLSRYSTSPHRSPTIVCSVLRCIVHDRHTQGTWRIVRTARESQLLLSPDWSHAGRKERITTGQSCSSRQHVIMRVM
jgi:hypothetical protein